MTTFWGVSGSDVCEWNTKPSAPDPRVKDHSPLGRRSRSAVRAPEAASERSLEGLHWHTHTDLDEFFYVVDGKFIIDLEGRSIELCPRQAFVVPKGVVHRTRAPERTVVLMVEGAGIVPTGDRHAGAKGRGSRRGKPGRVDYSEWLSPIPGSGTMGGACLRETEPEFAAQGLNRGPP
jgi:mannose-6-phosphate isomerase-like protein (cupin superfamily)